MRTPEQQAVIDLGKATKRLMETSDYQKVIQEGFIQSKLNALGMDFDGSEADVDALKAIVSLQTYLQSNLTQAEILIQSNKSN